MSALNCITKCIAVASMLSSICVLAAQQTKQESGIVSGTVIAPDENPVTVHLRASVANPLRYYDGYEQVADPRGHFHFVGVEPGWYTLEAESATAHSSASEKISIQPNKETFGLSLTLLPRPVLCGHVTEDGKPRKSTLHLYHYDPESGMLIERWIPNGTETDGSFRITDVPPGTSYLKAYQTWFPGSYSFNGAQSIDSSQARAACTYDIAYTWSGCMARKITGTIAHVPEDAGRTYHVVFLEK